LQGFVITIWNISLRIGGGVVVLLEIYIAHFLSLIWYCHVYVVVVEVVVGVGVVAGAVVATVAAIVVSTALAVVVTKLLVVVVVGVDVVVVDVVVVDVEVVDVDVNFVVVSRVVMACVFKGVVSVGGCCCKIVVVKFSCSKIVEAFLPLFLLASQLQYKI
jgi:hypothetical protein